MAVTLWPEIDPYQQGHLEVADGHILYWEACGNPAGKPAVALHGGPRSGSGPIMRRYFDPNAYRIVLFDQRGCGRSRPHASDPAVDLSTNTTDHLIVDLEQLRLHLGIDSWLAFGGSWGSTPALAYAEPERHPERVTELIIFSVGTTRRHEVEWMTVTSGACSPSSGVASGTAFLPQSETGTWPRPTTACSMIPTPPCARRHRFARSQGR
jgi:proline iminopeptidase